MEGTAQNRKDAFNQFAWQRCRKQIFVSKQLLENGVYSSVLTYNDGFISLKDVFKKLDIKPVKYFLEGAYARDCLRVIKDKRKKLRATRKGFVDKDGENEGGHA